MSAEPNPAPEAARPRRAPVPDSSRLDCLQFLQGLPDGSVDLIATDPAYSGMNQHLQFGHGRIVGHYGKAGNERWFTEFHDDPETFRRFLAECYRVLREDRHFYVMFDDFSLLSLGHLVRGVFAVKNLIVWDKVNLGMGHYFRRRTSRSSSPPRAAANSPARPARRLERQTAPPGPLSHPEAGRALQPACWRAASNPASPSATPSSAAAPAPWRHSAPGPLHRGRHLGTRGRAGAGAVPDVSGERSGRAGAVGEGPQARPLSPRHGLQRLPGRVGGGGEVRLGVRG